MHLEAVGCMFTGSTVRLDIARRTRQPTVLNMNVTECEPAYRTVSGVATILPILQIFTNAVPLIAVICFRRRLSRLNSVYIHVKNTLVSNIVLGFSVAYTTLNFALVFERPVYGEHTNRYDKSDPVHRSIMTWWTFQKSFTLCMLFVMLSSVGGLIFSLKQRTFLTSFSHTSYLETTASLSFRNIFGSLANIGNPDVQQKTLFHRSQAYIIVTLSWLLPIGCSLLATFFWNCRDTCKCLPATYNENCFVDGSDPDSQWCSQEWFPISGHFVVLFLTIWTIQVISLIIMLYRSIKHYKWNVQFSKHHVALTNVATIPIRQLVPRDMTLHYAALRSGRLQSFGPAVSDYENDDFTPASFMERPRLSTIPEEPVSGVGSSRITSDRASVEHDETISSTSNAPEKRPSSLSPSLKLVIVLSATVISCTLPCALIMLCDLVMPSDQSLDPVIFYLAEAALFVHVLSCPLFLIKYLSDLKQATNRLLLRCTKF